MSNPRIELDGAWDFQMDPAAGWDSAAIQTWRTAHVPMPWQAQFDDLRMTSGVAWYRRTVTLDDASADRARRGAAILHFGAVDESATVWVNGAQVGAHAGGYLPFAFDIAAHLHAGENELVVRVEDASDDRTRYPERPFSEVPHGKQSWYGPIGGIWQSVWLELRPRLHIAALRAAADPASATIRVAADLSAPLPDGARVEAAAFAPDGSEVARTTLDATGHGTLALDGAPLLWGLDAPNLYTVGCTLVQEGADAHTARVNCGFRTVEARDGRIYLNGEPIYLRAALDQGYYPETIYTPPSLEYLEAQARAAKALGLNCLRIHIKVEDPRYYDVADRLGLLVWTEIPNWALLTDAAAQRGAETFRAMLARDGHHPSIIAWTLINENWGTDLPRNPAHRRWLADFYHAAKAMDPTRLIVDNSACCDNFHVAGDLEDFHHYRTLPDHAKEWDAWVADFARRAPWAWANDYAHERRADAPLIVSEFGNWGLPAPADTYEHGREPWWFETGFDWGEGIVYPHNVERRVADCGLGALFPTIADFAHAAQSHMVRSLHYEISTMRLHDDIGGYVITELTDVHWEGNGLLTLQRRPKQDVETLFTAINQDRVLVLRPAAWSGGAGASVEVTARTFGVEGPEAAGTIEWQAGAHSGRLAAPGGVISVPLAAAGMVALQAQWLADDGGTLATNQVELACVPPAAPTSAPTLRVVDDPALAATLHALGYRVAQAPAAPHEILVARAYTPALQAAVQQGARLLLLAGEPAAPAATLPLPVGMIIPRANSAWQGDWANSFLWLRKQGALAHLPGGPLLEMEYAAIAPDAVLAGLPPWVLRDHSWAGLAVGWVHRAVSLLTVMPYGRGRMLATTFKLNADTLAGDAIAQALWAGMLELLGG